MLCVFVGKLAVVRIRPHLLLLNLANADSTTYPANISIAVNTQGNVNAPRSIIRVLLRSPSLLLPRVGDYTPQRYWYHTSGRRQPFSDGTHALQATLTPAGIDDFPREGDEAPFQLYINLDHLTSLALS